MASFIERMNEKAIELGLQNTTFADPSGLNPNNLSSAFDLSHLITFAASDERIAPIMRTPVYKVTTSRRMIPIHSTNRLVMNGDVEVMGGKTGFISKSGYCLATLLRLPQATPSPSSSSAPRRTTAASGRRATCSRGSHEGGELFSKEHETASWLGS